MKLTPLPIQAELEQYQQQADELYAAYAAGDTAAIRQMKDGHPQWWRLQEVEFKQLNITPADAQVIIAWYYAFNSWDELTTWVAAVTQPGSPTARFETAVDAIVNGDIKILDTLLKEDTALISARSMRFHHSMLLHYTGTNGVEGYRQRYPPNAVKVLQFLLAAGAEVNAEAGMYGGGSTTLGLLATSIHPAKAGIMSTMLEILLKAGAFIDQPGAAGNGSPAINGCLHNGRPEAADFLMRHGALLDLEGAAGTGRLDVVQTFFNEDGSLKDTATNRQMNYGFMWACEFGHTAVIDFLVGKGLDINVDVDGMYGLHWALIGGHLDVVRLLIAHGASLELRNMYGGNAIGCCTWAIANSSEVYRWPEKEVDYIVIMEELLKTGTPIERGMLACPAILSPVSRHLVVSDVARSVAFYCDVLGFNIAPDAMKGNIPAQAEVTYGPARIQFYTEEGLTVDSSGPMRPRGSAMLFFEVENVQLMHAAIAARGGQPSRPEKMNWIKIEMFEVRDPDGHALWFGKSYHEFYADLHIEAGKGQLRKALPELPLNDVAAGVAWYRDVLGFRINYQQHDLGVMDRDSITLLLIARTPQHTGIGSCGFYINNADALYAELLAKGAHIPVPPVSHPWGLRSFEVIDPEGNRLSFSQTFE